MYKERAMVNVGLVGLGFMGKMHFDVHQSNPRSRVVALCDVQQRRLEGQWGDIGGNIEADEEMKTDLTGIRTYHKLDELLSDKEIDLVDITLPTFLHANAAISALKAGKHVLCEKPMALTTRECDRMIRAAQSKDRILMVAHCIRFWPEYEAAHRIIVSGQYGPVRMASFHRLSSTPIWSWDNWLMDSKRSGSALTDLHIHDVDFVLQTFGLPQRVYAQGCSAPSDGADHVISSYDFGNNQIISLEGAWDMPPVFGFNMGFTIVMESGALIWDLADGKPLRLLRGNQSEPIACEKGDGYQREIDYVLNCVEQGESPMRCPPVQSREAVRLVLAEKKSIQTGKLVPIKPLA